MFECDMCGECCRHVGESEIYSFLDDGTGKCRYLSGDLCSVYKSRPLVCRLDECYEVFFKDEMTLEEYYELNHRACEILKKKG